MADARTRVLMLGSSHFSEHHHFKNLFKYVAGLHPRVRSVAVRAASGGSLDHTTLDSMHDFITSNPPARPLLIMVMLACNFIRSHPTELPVIISRHEDLIKQAGKYPNVQVVLCGLIPCPRTDHWTREPFRQMNKALKQLANDHLNVCYFNTPYLFVSNEIIIRNYFSDGLHLNYYGATMLCYHIRTFLDKLILLKAEPL